LRGARAAHIQRVGTDRLVFGGAPGKGKVRRVESDQKDVFAFAAFGRVKRGKDDFAIHDTVVHFVRLKGGNVNRNVFFDQFVGQTGNVVISRFDAVRQNEKIGRGVPLFQKVLDTVQNNVFDLMSRATKVRDLWSVATGHHQIFSQHDLIDKGGHGLGETVRGSQRAPFKDGTAQMRTGLPELIGHGQEARIGAFEFIERLSGIALVHELEKEGRHVLAFVQHDYVICGNRLSRGHVGGQELANARVDGGLVGVMFDGETVKRVHLKMGQFEGHGLVFDFQTQHFVVRELQNAQMRVYLGHGQDGGGLARSRARFDNDIFAGMDVIEDELLFWTGFVHLRGVRK